MFCVLYTAAIAAQTKSQMSALSPDKTRTEVHRLGFGKRVKVKLQNGARMRGRITGLAGDQFVVTDSNTGVAMKVAYAEVAVIRKQREMPRIFRGAFTGIAFTAAVVSTLIVSGLRVLD